MKAAAKRRSKNILVKLILIAFAVFAIFTLAKLQIQLIQKKDDLAELKAEEQVKQQNADELNSLIEKGDSSDLIERSARDKLDYVYADEDIITDATGN